MGKYNLFCKYKKSMLCPVLRAKEKNCSKAGKMISAENTVPVGPLGWTFCLSIISKKTTNIVMILRFILTVLDSL